MRSRDVVGKTRRRLAAEQLADLFAVEKKIKSLSKELQAMVDDSGSSLTQLPGVGPIVAARVTRHHARLGSRPDRQHRRTAVLRDLAVGDVRRPRGQGPILRSTVGTSSHRL